MVLFLTNVWSVLLDLAPWLLLGAVAAALLHLVLPPGLVRRQLNGRLGVVKAVALGVPLPLCSCGVIPAGLGLRQDGASKGSAIGFITATPQTGVDSMLVSASFLGWPFALYKVGAALLTGVMSGWVTDAVTEADPPQASTAAKNEHRPTPAQALTHGISLIRMIWRWVVFGVLVSAAITTFVPDDALSFQGAAGTVGAYLAVLVIAVPLYVCATASVPIAASLVAAGMPTGAALVFLMAGPATNTATIGAVYRGFGSRSLWVYLGTILVGSIGLGLLYEPLLGGLSIQAEHVHGGASLLGELSAAVLLIMMTTFAAEDLRGLLRGRADVTDKPTIEVKVEGMTCGGCASRLQRVLLAAEGVDTATVSFEEGKAVVAGSATTDDVFAIVRGAGFDPA